MMRTCMVLALAAAAAAACSSKKSTPTTPPGNGGGDPATLPPPPPVPLGSSGLPRLDWGASAHEIEVDFPGAVTEGAEVTFTGDYRGQPARYTFKLDDSVLSRVEIAFTTAFSSMDACSEIWKTLRTDLDRDFGHSSSDNLAAYWDAAAASIELACNPVGDGEPAALSLSFSPHGIE